MKMSVKNVSNVVAVEEIDSIKQEIINKFLDNVKGKKVDLTGVNCNHDGKEGHWLETQMGISHNRLNEPDFLGYEMKNDTTSKTTFGDWSADYYIFKDKKYGIDKSKFLKIFGKPNEEKGGRCSWSGEPIPKINKYSSFGQLLSVNKKGDISITYNFKQDKRSNKFKIIPETMRKEKLLLAQWKMETLKQKVERKFNQLGWFTCVKDKSGTYCQIFFGPPITWKIWLSDVKKGFIFFDSGMYEGNSRNYSQWRADNTYWKNHRLRKVEE